MLKYLKKKYSPCPTKTDNNTVVFLMSQPSVGKVNHNRTQKLNAGNWIIKLFKLFKIKTTLFSFLYMPQLSTQSWYLFYFLKKIIYLQIENYLSTVSRNNTTVRKLINQLKTLCFSRTNWNWNSLKSQCNETEWNEARQLRQLKFKQIFKHVFEI